MIFELMPEHFNLAASLFAPIWYDEAQVGAALSGRQPGRLFVDDPARPTAGLLCRSYGFYPAGDAGSAVMRRFIADAPAEAGIFDTLYGYMVDDVWRAALLHDHGDDLETIGREAFHFPAAMPVPTVESPPGVSLLALDGVLAARVDDEMGQLIGLFWGGYEPFDVGGFGSCALVDGKVAAVAYAIAVSERTANIDIETAAPFRRCGLATLVSGAFVAACRARGLTATWGCDTANTASAALATKLGFVRDEAHAQLSPRPGVAKVRTTGVWRRVEDGTSRIVRSFVTIGTSTCPGERHVRDT